MNPSKIIDLEIKSLQKDILEAIENDNKELENELFLKNNILLELYYKFKISEAIRDKNRKEIPFKNGVEYLFKDGELKEFNKAKEFFRYVNWSWFGLFFSGISLGIFITSLIK